LYDDDLTNLENWLRRLKVEYEIFFNGHRKKPPEDLKIRVEKLVKRLSEAQNMSCSERFRFNTLIARYYVYRDLWRRTLMLREAGDEIRANAPSAAPAPLTASQVSVSIANSEAEDGKVRELYDALLNIKGGHAVESPSISYPQFASYIARKTQSIRGKHGCPSVLFTIVLQENAVRFTATAETHPHAQSKQGPAKK
jgi:hypothetical protein